MVVAGWFDGLTTEQLTVAAVALLDARTGFVLQWWGLAETTSSERRMISALEVGDRAVQDTDRENGGHAIDRRDWIVSKAVLACPIPFTDFIALGAGRQT